MTQQRDIVWQLELIGKGGAVGLGEEWRRERCTDAATEIERLRGIIGTAETRLAGVSIVKPKDPNIILDQIHGALETLRSV